MAEQLINGRTFKIEPVLATKALILQAKIARVAGPLVARLGDIMRGYGTDKTPEEKAKSDAMAILAFSEIFAEVAPEELAQLVKEVVELASIKRPSGYGRIDFDGDFTGYGSDIIPVTVFILRELFGDFFSGMVAVGAQSQTVRELSH